LPSQYGIALRKLISRLEIPKSKEEINYALRQAALFSHLYKFERKGVTTLIEKHLVSKTEEYLF
jgi:hypothetical protein